MTILKRVLFLIPLGLGIAACGTDLSPVDGDSSPVAAEVTTTSTHPPGDRPGGGEGVRVAITGYLVAGENGVAKVCATGEGGACPGVLMLGGAPSLSDPANMVRLVGVYNGSDIVVGEWTEVAPLERDFSNPCAISSGGSGNPSDAATVAVNAVVADYSDRFAGMWWDSGNQVMTVWFTGAEIDSLRDTLEAAAGDDMALCVIGGAAHSERKLQDIQMSLDDVIDYSALGVSYTSVDVLGNRVEVGAEFNDLPTRAAIAESYGDAVVFQAFIEVLEGAVADLPAPLPAVLGDLPLVTQSNRGGGGMDALGRFEVRYDAELKCVYFPGDEQSAEPGAGGRTLPVWPFGYTAESDPLRIFDFEGTPVASEGDIIEMGGGFVSIEFVEADETCGATGAWIASSPPVIVGP